MLCIVAIVFVAIYRFSAMFFDPKSEIRPCESLADEIFVGISKAEYKASEKF